MPLHEIVSAPDGGFWLVLPAAEPTGDRIHALGRIDPDGTMRRVDHPLPPVTAIAPNPTGDSVLLVDHHGRMLELTHPDRHTEPLPPPPPSCNTTDAPAPEPPAHLTPGNSHITEAR